MDDLGNRTAEQTERTAEQTKPRPRRWWLFGGLAASVAALAACAHGAREAGAGEGAMAGGGWGGHHHRHRRGPLTPEQMAGRIDRGVDRVLSQVGATAEQKQRVAAIAKQALGDVAPLRAQHREARRRAVELLAEPTVDRSALEQLRAEQLRLADAGSRRITQSLADAAEVLTPEQRATLKTRFEQRFRPWPGS